MRVSLPLSSQTRMIRAELLGWWPPETHSLPERDPWQRAGGLSFSWGSGEDPVVRERECMAARQGKTCF